MKIVSLGGSGEDSRNCFLIECANKMILLDCGVRRELASISRVYPRLTEKIAKNISFVLLSHAHEDHCAAIPYLYRLGFNGAVYCSDETAKNAPKFIAKWKRYVLSHNGTLPFSEEDIERIRFRTIDLGESEVESIHITTGRSGHIIGSMWFKIDVDGSTILYTGDYSRDSLILDNDNPIEAENLIVDSAYADSSFNQERQYENLFELVSKTIDIGGTALLPVPVNGRGIDIALYLVSRGIEVLTDSSLIANARSLISNEKWVRKSSILNDLDHLVPYSENEISGRAIVVGDGMMTTGSALSLFNKLKDDARNHIILTGHAAKGTTAYNVLLPDYRISNNIKCEASRITIKVHPDYGDVLELCRIVRPSTVMLFHAPGDRCEKLKAKLESIGFSVLCGL